MSKSPLRMAIVGINNQGRDHLDAILACEAVQLVALCDSDGSLLENVAAEYNLQDIYLDEEYERTAQRDDVDALVIALPHHLHPSAVEHAVRSGKHLLKEKPIARNLLEAHEMARQMRQAGLVLHTGVQRRHHGTYRFLHKALQGHQVQSASIEITIDVRPTAPGEDPSKNWRNVMAKAGGGLLLDLGYHGVDLLHYLIGPMELLSCVTRREGGPCPSTLVDDDARLWAVAGSTWVSMHFGRADRKVESLVIDTDRGRFLADREVVEFQPRTARGGFGPAETLHTAQGSWEITMREQLLTFCRAVEHGDLTPNDINEELPTMRFLEACYRRRDQGFTPEPRVS